MAPQLFIVQHGMENALLSRVTTWSLLVMDGKGSDFGTLFTLNIPAPKPPSSHPDRLSPPTANTPIANYGLSEPLRLDFHGGSLVKNISNLTIQPHLNRSRGLAFCHYDFGPNHILLGHAFLGHFPSFWTGDGYQQFMMLIKDAWASVHADALKRQEIFANKPYLLTQEWVIRAVRNLNVPMNLGLGPSVTRSVLADMLDKKATSDQ